MCVVKKKVVMSDTPRDWGSWLVNAFALCSLGDVIVVNSEDQKELAERAKNRLYPDADISFEVKEQSHG